MLPIIYELILENQSVCHILHIFPEVATDLKY